MRVLSEPGTLSERIRKDPRLSDAQRESLKRTAEADPEALMLGLDQKMRPVIHCTLDGPGRTQYAILRNGDPALPVMPLAETWRNGRRSAT